MSRDPGRWPRSLRTWLLILFLALSCIATTLPALANPVIGGKRDGPLMEFLRGSWLQSASAIAIISLLSLLPALIVEWIIVVDAFAPSHRVRGSFRTGFILMNAVTILVLNAALILLPPLLGHTAARTPSWLAIGIGEALVILAESRYYRWWSDRSSEDDFRRRGAVAVSFRANLASAGMGALILVLIDLFFTG